MKTALEANRINELLVGGGPPAWALNSLTVSVRLFESVYAAPLGVLPLPEPGEAEQGIHQVALFGGRTRSGGLRFVNSWGGAWGDGGRGVLSREYVERYMVEAWLGRFADVGPTRFSAPLLDRASDPASFVAAWVPTLPGLREAGFAAIDRRVDHDGAEHLVRIRETLSASDDPVEMIELHGPSGVPLGWAHLHHLTGRRPRISICKEFFVWPLTRGRGHGRLLEGQVAERAREWGSERIEVPFHEADDHAGGAHAAKAFSLGAGYGWPWARTGFLPPSPPPLRRPRRKRGVSLSSVSWTLAYESRRSGSSLNGISSDPSNWLALGRYRRAASMRAVSAVHEVFSSL